MKPTEKKKPTAAPAPAVTLSPAFESPLPDPVSVLVEAEEARIEGFFAETAALMLHALLNRQNSLPTPEQIAEKAIDYTEALCEKLEERGV